MRLDKMVVLPLMAFLFTVQLSSNAFAFGRQISVMTYNAENLFDTRHDPGKNDWTYLPLAEKRSNQDVQDYCRKLRNRYYRQQCLTIDWSYKVLKQKSATSPR